MQGDEGVTGRQDIVYARRGDGIVPMRLLQQGDHSDGERRAEVAGYGIILSLSSRVLLGAPLQLFPGTAAF